MTLQSISRRAFLVGSGGTVVGVMVGGLGVGNLAQAAQEAANQASGFNPVAWVSIGPDNSVTIYSPGAEMGQGTMTAIPSIFAEDMELDWSLVKVEKSPNNAKLFGNPKFGGGMVTGSSRTVVGYYDVMRLAGLQAKLVLVNAAAEQWGVPATEITAEKSLLKHVASNRQMTYGQAAAKAQAPDELPKVDISMLKPMSEFKIIGQSLARVDVASKSNGTARFGLDTRLPGMVWAAVLYAPVQGETPETVDDTAATQIAGVKKVIKLKHGVAVVADSFATAQKARAALKVTWSTSAKARGYDSDEVMKDYVRLAESTDKAGDVWDKHGDASAALKGAERTFQATYTTAHVAQCTMEPMNCTARVDGERIELWVPSQSGSIVVGTVAAVGGFKPENITVHTTLLGGGYGRRVEADYAVDAVALAKELPGVPVQVIWTREDDFQRSRSRPLTAQHLVAGVDKQGKIVGWHHRLVSEGIYSRVNPKAYQGAGNKDAPVMEGADGIYEIPAFLIEHSREERGIDVSFWRGVGAGYTKFALETLIDEVAEGLEKDPLQLRLELTGKTPRAQAVLREAALMAGWEKQRPEGRALGLAFSDAWSTFIAMVVEVSLENGRPLVHQVWSAVDCGHAISPKNVQAQVEGAALFGLSALLGEQLDYKGGEVQQRNFDSYPLLRANQTPLFEVKVMPTDNPPGGMGEVGLPPIAPAVANAVARLTGQRIRALPFPKAV
ncbi:MAG TPA: molybdopterin cofactor-binding domain-containing protein [Pusillimonas sp.]|uniref:xanthine dehydrogenase family protein molybdopterin-binding subunit n=1 Tax=Pusillimonas sp. TaxID=3040095 RepID=UPI002CF6EA7D|nr:molybdopterin cofactor-binding domain-containing protein [Pusillimonas sp.]HUH88161.1 molybdopterin cofactor-binding domain-containing protein [Pusillimonas sp.]